MAHKNIQHAIALGSIGAGDYMGDAQHFACFVKGFNHELGTLICEELHGDTIATYEVYESLCYMIFIRLF